jgi:hypothetical protein
VFVNSAAELQALAREAEYAPWMVVNLTLSALSVIRAGADGNQLVLGAA